MSSLGLEAEQLSAARESFDAWCLVVDTYDAQLRAIARHLSPSPARQDAACKLAWLRLAQRLENPPPAVLAWLVVQVAVELQRADWPVPGSEAA